MLIPAGPGLSLHITERYSCPSRCLSWCLHTGDGHIPRNMRLALTVCVCVCVSVYVRVCVVVVHRVGGHSESSRPPNKSPKQNHRNTNHMQVLEAVEPSAFLHRKPTVTGLTSAFFVALSHTHSHTLSVSSVCRFVCPYVCLVVCLPVSQALSFTS